jgi:hypothetical protein
MMAETCPKISARVRGARWSMLRNQARTVLGLTLRSWTRPSFGYTWLVRRACMARLVATSTERSASHDCA